MFTFKKYIFLFTLTIFLVFYSSHLFSLAAQIDYPLIVADDTGISVTIESEPQRIISAAPNNTEILFALGLGDKVVGVTNYDNYPEEVNLIEKIGEMSPLNLEKIVALKPDLILTFAIFQLKEIERLRELGFKVLDIEPVTLEDTLERMKMIARVCGIPKQGEIIVGGLLQRVEIIKTKVAQIDSSRRPKIFIGGTHEIIYTPGANTLFDELISLAGGENIARVFSGWIKINPELVAEKAPDIIIVPVGVMNPGDQSRIKEDISKRPGWSNIPAIKNQKIFIVNEDLFYRPGPRLVDGLEKLYEIFYQ